MHIEKFSDAIMNCRFCFMCRHLSAIGNVRHTEVDTPRVRAAMIYGLGTGTNSFDDDDFVDALYRQDLSACCVRHCVNHYDENGLALAARADVVEAGKAPEAVKALAADFAASAAWKVAGKGDLAWFLDATTASDKAAVAAAKKLFAAAKATPATITGGCIGKALKVLGYLPEAKAAAEKFAAFLKDAGVKTLIVSNPAAYDALTKDYADFGVKLPCKVLHISQFVLQTKVKFAKKPAAPVYPLADDFLRNYDNLDAPEKLLKALKAETKPFGTNDEESYCCGEGAVVLDKLHPELVTALAEYVAARADNPKTDVIVVASVYVKRALCKAGLKAITLEELAASAL
jgi:Fe-S oxidoreductase